jgi:sortase A
VQDQQQDGRHKSARRLLGWAERLFVIVGVALLATCAWFVIDARLAQRAARQSLEIALPNVPTSASPAAATAAPAGLSVVVSGTPLAALSIPRVHLSAIVLEGSDARTLRRGPGHLENTALPGDAGNVVIAGHRDTFFRPLRDVHTGDDVFIETRRGTLRYRVNALRVVKASDLSVLEPSDAATLTLITCYPFWVLGDAPDRFIVQAERVDQPTAVAAMPTPPVSVPAEVLVSDESSLATARSASAPVVPADDETLVREVIERYRLAYNGLSASRSDLTPPLRFDRCDVTVDGEAADASCQSAASPRTFVLQRAAGGWAIKTVIVK